MNRFGLATVMVLLPLLIGCPKTNSPAKNPGSDAAARYEVISGSATALNGTQMALIIRVDRVTGKSWALKQQKLAQFGGTQTPDELEALEAGMAWEWVPIGDPPPEKR